MVICPSTSYRSCQDRAWLNPTILAQFELTQCKNWSAVLISITNYRLTLCINWCLIYRFASDKCVHTLLHINLLLNAAWFLPDISIHWSANTPFMMSPVVIAIVRDAPVLQLPSEVRTWPCDIVAKRPFTFTRLLSPCYTERRPSHNLIYTVDYTFSYCSKKFIYHTLAFVCVCPWYKLQSRKF